MGGLRLHFPNFSMTRCRACSLASVSCLRLPCTASLAHILSKSVQLFAHLLSNVPHLMKPDLGQVPDVKVLNLNFSALLHRVTPSHISLSPQFESFFSLTTDRGR